jgi:hypothetical protein
MTTPTDPHSVMFGTKPESGLLLSPCETHSRLLELARVQALEDGFHESKITFMEGNPLMEYLHRHDWEYTIQTLHTLVYSIFLNRNTEDGMALREKLQAALPGAIAGVGNISKRLNAESVDVTSSIALVLIQEFLENVYSTGLLMGTSYSSAVKADDGFAEADDSEKVLIATAHVQAQNLPRSTAQHVVPPPVGSILVSVKHGNLPM